MFIDNSPIYFVSEIQRATGQLLATETESTSILLTTDPAVLAHLRKSVHSQDQMYLGESYPVYFQHILIISHFTN